MAYIITSHNACWAPKKQKQTSEYLNGKYYRWKVVIHDVTPHCLSLATELTSKLGTVRQINGVEPTEHQVDNFHLHFYGQWKTQKYFNPLLKEFTRIASKVSALQGTNSRVQIDTWDQGQTWDNVTKYLVNPTKHKQTGPIQELTTSKEHFLDSGTMTKVSAAMFQAGHLGTTLPISNLVSMYDLGVLPTNSPSGTLDKIHAYKYANQRPRVKPRDLYSTVTV